MGFVLLAVAAYLLFRNNGNNSKKNPFENINNSGLFGENTKGLLESLSRLNQSGQGINMNAILELLSNPLVFELLKNFFVKGAGAQASAPGTASGTGSAAPASAADTAAASAAPASANANPPAHGGYSGIDALTGSPVFSSAAQSAQAPEQPRSAGALTHSEESREFFKPVEKVAGPISEELYSYYDNWYINK